MKKVFIVLAAAGFLTACNNSADTVRSEKDSLDSIANAKKDAIDSTAEQRKDAIDSLTEQKKDNVDTTGTSN